MRAAAVAAVLLLAASAQAVPPPAADASPYDLALRFLVSRQQPEGHFKGVMTANVLEALAAGGVDPAAWPTPERSALAALARHPAQPHAVFSALRPAYALGVTGYDAAAWAGGDLVAEIRASFDGAQFGAPEALNDDVFAILALRAAGVPPDDAAIQAAADTLLASRAAEGGWGHTRNLPTSSVDMTGFALAALAAAGRDVEGDPRARVYVESQRDPVTGGYRNPEGPDCQATAWAIHARALLGMPPDDAAERFLLSLQDEEGGVRKTPGAATPDPFCTVEAAVVFAGARYPLPGRVPVGPFVAHAGEPATLALPGDYASATWRSDAFGRWIGTRVTTTFPHAGRATAWVDASGPEAVFRGAVAIDVRSARPALAPLPPEVEALRLVPVELDVSGADADGVVSRASVDWGDGNATVGAPGVLAHAYAEAGEFVVRARVQDDAGEWSDAQATRVHVRNRAPLLLGVPARLVADRAHDVVLAPDARDPEGDPVSLSWTAGASSGEGAARFRPSALGNATLSLVARDDRGGEARADVAVEVVNLPPRLADLALPADARADAPLALRVAATDEDGPAPAVAWRVGNATREGASIEVALPAGRHPLVVEAVDADGGRARLEATLVVLAPEAEPAPAAAVEAAPSAPDAPAPPLEPPAFADLAEAPLAGRDVELRVRPVAGAAEYAFDFGDGATRGWSAEPAASHAWPRPGAFEVRVSARAADGRASHAAMVLLVDAPPAPAPRPARAAEPPAASPPAEEAPLEHTGTQEARGGEVLTVAQAPRQESPGAGAAAALLALALATRRRRA